MAAAVLGGYAVAAVVTVFLALYLPLARSEATTAATLSSFVVYTVAAVWAFTASSMLSAWIGLAVTAAAFGGAILVGAGA